MFELAANQGNTKAKDRLAKIILYVISISMCYLFLTDMTYYCIKLSS
jgi:hypothetical protein